MIQVLQYPRPGAGDAAEDDGPGISLWETEAGPEQDYGGTLTGPHQRDCGVLLEAYRGSQKQVFSGEDV